jgi:nucleotide-binding universal stress UspA family protein
MRIQLNRILCATDFSDFSNQTIPYGIALAQQFEAHLLVCHIIDLPFASIAGEVQIDPIEQQNRMVDYAHGQLAELFADESIDWEPLVTVGHTADEIDRFVKNNGVDLVVSATHGRSGIKRLLLGSVTERMMRTLSCPLLIIREKKEDGFQPPKIKFSPKRILVGCDFSSDSNLAYQYGLSLAQEVEAELHLIHVVEPPIYQSVLPGMLDVNENPRQPILSILEEKLDQMVPEDARHWCKLNTTLLEGKPDEELSRYARLNDIDLVVLGVRGHSLVETLFVGSTTDRVARSAPCPVLAVRPTV